MTPIEKLIKQIRHLLEMINYPEISGSDFIKEIDEAVQEYESAPKPWAPPWPLKIPDWPNVWFCVDLDGEGVFFQLEPHVCEESEIHYQRGEVMYVGYFEIPPGVDWRTMKIQVKKDGVLLR